MKVMNTDNEKTLYSSQSSVYTDLARSCLDAKIGIDMFVFNSDYFDLATVSALNTITGGSLYYYHEYNPDFDSEKLHYELFRNLTRQYGYDAIMTLRSSQGITL